MPPDAETAHLVKKIPRNHPKSKTHHGESDHDGTVCIWRTRWLEPSETFIADHVSSLRQWRPVLMGLRRLENDFGPRPDIAPFTAAPIGPYFEKVARRLQYRGVYDHFLSRHRPGLLHAHYGTDALEIAAVAQRHSLPLIVTFHGYDLTLAVARDHTGEYRTKLRRLFDQAELLLPVSDYLASILRELGAPEHKIRRHYLGIRTENRNTPSGGQPSDIAFVGRHVAKKGVHDLVAAIEMLPAADRDGLKVLIMGDGVDRKQAEMAAHRIEGPEWTFTGRVTPAEVEANLSASKVFVAPSKIAADGDAEGFGLVFLEAARARLPVVAYRSAGVVEAVDDGHTGMLAEEGNIRELSAYIRRLVADPQLAQQMGSAGRERLLTKFALERQTRSLEETYSEVAYRRSD